MLGVSNVLGGNSFFLRVVSGVIGGAIISFIMSLLEAGWKERFMSYTIE